VSAAHNRERREDPSGHHAAYTPAVPVGPAEPPVVRTSTGLKGAV